MIRTLAFQFKAQVENQNSLVTKNCVICMTPGQRFEDPVPKPDCMGQNYFHNKTMMVFAL